MSRKIASEAERRARVRKGVAANQANMRYYPYAEIPASRFAGTRTEKIAVTDQARRQSKTGRPLSSLGAAAKNAIKKNIHKSKRKPKKPRGVSEDLMKLRDRKSQESEAGGNIRRGY